MHTMVADFVKSHFYYQDSVNDHSSFANHATQGQTVRSFQTNSSSALETFVTIYLTYHAQTHANEALQTEGFFVCLSLPW